MRNGTSIKGHEWSHLDLIILFCITMVKRLKKGMKFSEKNLAFDTRDSTFWHITLCIWCLFAVLFFRQVASFQDAIYCLQWIMVQQCFKLFNRNIRNLTHRELTVCVLFFWRPVASTGCGYWLLTASLVALKDQGTRLLDVLHQSMCPPFLLQSFLG